MNRFSLPLSGSVSLSTSCDAVSVITEDVAAVQFTMSADLSSDQVKLGRIKLLDRAICIYFWPDASATAVETATVSSLA